jgi:putative CocE/NonD family hydrolase
MGENKWHAADAWPPAGYTETAFYLHSDGKANTRGGSGILNRNAPVAEEPTDHFKADPADPVPACPVTDQRPLHAATWAPVDQRSIEDRPDVLVYTSEPLTAQLTFAGDARAELFVSADTPDADWVVKLIDVHPDGAAYNLTVGILRGRFRDSELHSKLLTPGEVYRITVDLGPVAAQIQPGHRLRVDVCGAYFPLFDRNANTADGILVMSTAVAAESVYHSQSRPSRILLPIRTDVTAGTQRAKQ